VPVPERLVAAVASERRHGDARARLEAPVGGEPQQRLGDLGVVEAGGGRLSIRLAKNEKKLTRNTRRTDEKSEQRPTNR
jgi:hypothetical protein